VEDALVSGMNQQHYIASDHGPRSVDSTGNPWNADFMTARGNLAECVRLRSAAVQTLALALHELVTNALKYGALSRPEGRLVVR
jgi:hypothetical protein